ncbi:MAG: carboxypeptidase regulatory-like domain-containing protein [Acidobacteriota bacterium]
MKWITASTLFVCLCAQAQDSATLAGAVLDPSGAAVPGATLRLVELRRNIPRETTTDEIGYYRFSSLEPGDYSLEVSLTGFAKTEIRLLTLRARDRQSLRISLQLSSVKQSMDITGKEDILASDPSFGAVVDQRSIQTLPLAGRSIDTILLLAPGVVSAAGGRGGGDINSNGMRSNTNYYTLDGVSLNASISSNGGGFGGPGGGPGIGGLPGAGAGGGASGGPPTELVSVEALQEVRVQTSSFAPEFGRTPGAQISMSSRGGSDKFHGSVFEYFGNDRLNANQWFANSLGQQRAALRYNQFGGTVGGPVRKGKTSFFASYEGLRLVEPETNIATVPSMTTRERAPAALRPYLNAFPIPNGGELTNGAALFSAVYSNPSSRDSASLRIDHSLNARHALFFRYAYAPSDGMFRGEQTQTPNVLNSRTVRPHSFTGSLISQLSPNIVNDLRVNFTRSATTTSAAMDTYGGAQLLTDALLFPAGITAENGSFSLVVTGMSGLSYAAGSTSIQRQFNFVDSATLTAGPHQYKIGVDFRTLTPSYLNKLYSQSATFNGLVAANGSQDTTTTTSGSLLSGTSTMAVVSASLPRVDPMTINNSFYIQDTYRVSRKATVTFGGRWDVNPAPTVRNGDKPFALCDSDLGNCALTQQLPLYDTKWGNVALRLGFASQLTEDPGQEWVLRGGVGVFHDIGYGASTNTFNAAPYVSARNLVLPVFPLVTVDRAIPLLPQQPPYGQISAAERGLQSPAVYQWNLTFERSFGTAQVLSFGMAGSHGIRLLRTETSRAATNAYDLLRMATNGAESDYNSAQFQFRRRMARGFQMQAGYTYSHSMDTASSDNALSGGFRSLFGSQRGNSDFDVRHSFSYTASYNLPAPGRGFLKPVFSNWWADGVVTARSGLPFDVQGISAQPETLDTAETEALTSRGFFAQVRPDYTGQPVWIEDVNAPGGRRLNPNAFVMPTDFRQGTLGRNSLRGFPMSQVDLSVRRMIRLSEGVSLSMNMQAFNLLNSGNFANPSPLEGASLASPNFGVVTRIVTDGAGGGSAFFRRGGPRSVQFSLRLSF